MGPHPAVAAIRLAVRRELVDVGAQPVLVACSGGADSLALLAATTFEARKPDWHVVGVTVDHGLQEGSADRATEVVAQMSSLGAAETVTIRVSVEADGQGIEAAAREARYAVLSELAERFGSGVVLLGHTLDDQAETVLLGLTRGSGARSLAGMRRVFHPYRRPLLDIRRAQTEAACQAQGITWWDDPHNADRRFTRVRVRHTVLPMLEAELGPGVALSLARTADQLRADASALDELAGRALGESGLRRSDLAALHPAISMRVLRLAALEAGAPPAELFQVHLEAVHGLLTGAEAGKQVQLPGKVTGYLDGDYLRFRPTAMGG